MKAPPLVVAAQSVSAGLLARLDSRPARCGAIYGVHRRALGVLWRGELISAVAPEMGAFPNALVARVECVAGALRAGDRVSRVSEGLVVHSARPVVFDLSRAARWSPVLKPAVPAQGWAAVGARLEFVLRSLAPHAGSEGFGPLLAAMAPPAAPVAPSLMPALCRYALERIIALMRALETSDARALMPCALALSGLGPGLTPSGDDLLVGMLAGLVGAADPRAVLLAQAIRAISRNRTTLLAHTLLRHACAFEFSLRLHRLINALFAPDQADLEQSALAAIAWGESSGVDSLLGVLLGLGAVLRRARVAAALKLAPCPPIN